jgi:glycerol uptake facilitator protein
MSKVDIAVEASDAGGSSGRSGGTEVSAEASEARLISRLGLKGEMAAEFFGTMVLILFGDGVVAQVVAGNLGDHDSITWAWGFGVMLGVYIAGRASGAHLNPAVTLSLAIFKGFKWSKVLPYTVAQVGGAFTAAIIIRYEYASIINAIDPHHTLKTQGIFATLPGNGSLPVHMWPALADQVLGTAILLFCIFALIDQFNGPPPAGLVPLVIGLLVVAIGMAFGADAGYAINPARDFGPRLAEYLTGYSHAWRDQYGDLYFWVPIIGPLVGGVVGGGLYELCIGWNLKRREANA